MIEYPELKEYYDSPHYHETSEGVTAVRRFVGNWYSWQDPDFARPRIGDIYEPVGLRGPMYCVDIDLEKKASEGDRDPNSPASSRVIITATYKTEDPNDPIFEMTTSVDFGAQGLNIHKGLVWHRPKHSIHETELPAGKAMNVMLPTLSIVRSILLAAIPGGICLSAIGSVNSEIHPLPDMFGSLAAPGTLMLEGISATPTKRQWTDAFGTTVFNLWMTEFKLGYNPRGWNYTFCEDTGRFEMVKTAVGGNTIYNQTNFGYLFKGLI